MRLRFALRLLAPSVVALALLLGALGVTPGTAQTDAGHTSSAFTHSMPPVYVPTGRGLGLPASSPAPSGRSTAGVMMLFVAAGSAVWILATRVSGGMIGLGGGSRRVG